MTYDEKVQWLRRYQDSLRREQELAEEVEQLQNAAQEMMDLVDTLTAADRTEEAVSLRTALTGALQALAGQAADEGEEHHV